MNSRSLKDKGMYNEEIKLKFLEEQYSSEDSRRILAYIFYNSRRTEEQLGKDLYNFNINDITALLKDLSPRNTNVARSNGSVISAYINWSAENGYRQSNDNPLHGVLPSYYEDFVGERKLYLSKNQIDEIIEEIVNAQDSVILKLLFDGASGTKMSELLNLKKSDINWDTNSLKLTDDKYGDRELVVTDECMKLLNRAIDEKSYYSKNGTVEGKKSEIDLVDNEYVLRNIKVGAYGEGKGNPSLIYRRMDMIQELLDTGLESFTSKSITKSGMIYEGYRLFLEDGEIGSEQLSKVAEKFGVRKIKVGEYEYYNTSILGKFINRENILELYGVDIDKATE